LDWLLILDYSERRLMPLHDWGVAQARPGW
jgi:hypothetical protein